MEEGSLAVWDLRESIALHKDLAADGMGRRLRRPTYSTDGIPSAQNHQAGVVAIAAVPSPSTAGASVASTRSSAAAPSASFQLATLDQDGVFKTWTVVEELEPVRAGFRVA